MYRLWNFVQQYSLLLIFGALLALFFANAAPDAYHAFLELSLSDHSPIGEIHDGGRTLTLHYFINDVLMAFFFAIAGKEVWEAIILKDGSLRGKKALTPLIATVGGMLGPVAIYLLIAMLFGSTTFSAIQNGWAIPTATDIAFSYLVGRIVFGAGHPALQFLLLLAIADDAAGLIILAIFYPSHDLNLAWLLVSLGAALMVFVLANWLPRFLDRDDSERTFTRFVTEKLSFWPYALAGAVSWYAFQESGIHPALGLLPIVLTIPHADHDEGFFAEDDEDKPDLLNHIEHMLKVPVEVILFLFGLANAGVAFTAAGPATWAVLGGLLIGKPLGIFAFGLVGATFFGLAKGMSKRDLFTLGCVAAIGFTVSLFVTSVAFEGGAVQDAAKIGALLSFTAAGMAILAGILLRIERVEKTL